MLPLGAGRVGGGQQVVGRTDRAGQGTVRGEVGNRKMTKKEVTRISQDIQDIRAECVEAGRGHEHSERQREKGKGEMESKRGKASTDGKDGGNVGE